MANNLTFKRRKVGRHRAAQEDYLGDMRVMGLEYEVYAPGAMTLDGESKCGVMDGGDQAIFIQAGLSVENGELTLLHEALHVIDKELGLELGEDGVCALSNAMFQFLHDNSNFLKGFAKLYGKHTSDNAVEFSNRN